ncbi:hypothetical protein J2S15_002366 [Breznakia pachnodae]|uniref:Uncharacterized protein n=1 Tax=Breznakia pachnodae TaxID=265178 RepID=A0ABU0E464_9FIRM|nr:hypothetical protein [Breznakia pachnodae]
MNERYQRALDRLREVEPSNSLPLGTTLDECFIEEFNILQELVDRMNHWNLKSWAQI